MGQMKHAFILAALRYINQTNFDYDLEFDIDEAVDIAFSHWRRNKIVPPA